MSERFSQKSDIPAVPDSIPEDLKPILEALKYNVELGFGMRSADTINYDQNIRIGDLLDFDFLDRIGFTYGSFKNKDVGFAGDGVPPDPPTNFTVTPGIWSNHLAWTNPRAEDFAYVEVWISSVNDVTTAALSVMVHKPASSWTHFIYNEAKSTFYYWIRSVDYSGEVSDFVGLNGGGYEVIGDETVGETIDAILEILRGAAPPAYDPAAIYYMGNRVSYTGADGIERTYKCINDNGGAGITGIAPSDTAHWERSGILIQGDVDGVATVGIDGNLVVKDTILARSIKTDELIAGGNVTIANNSVHIGHIGTTNDDKKYLRNDYQYWSWVYDDDGHMPAPDADVTANQFTQTLANIDTGALRSINGFDTSYRITKAIKGSVLSGAPTAIEPGLWMTDTYLGYFDGTDWPVHIKSNGEFWFGKDINNYFAYSEGNLFFKATAAEAIRIYGGAALKVYDTGSIYVMDGGDIIMAAASSPSLIQFVGSTRTLSLGMDTSIQALCVYPSAATYGGFHVGRNTSGLSTPLASISLTAADNCFMTLPDYGMQCALFATAARLGGGTRPAVISGTQVGIEPTNYAYLETSFWLYNRGAGLTGTVDFAKIWAQDITGVTEFRCVDSAGNTTTLSPHNFTLFEPGESYLSPWSYYSENPYLGRRINVDMYGAILELEKLSGKKFIYVEDFEPVDWNADQQRQALERQADIDAFDALPEEDRAKMKRPKPYSLKSMPGWMQSLLTKRQQGN